MPKQPWTGYQRFCPLARALDVIGERWTLVIVQELLKRPRRYGELLRRLPGVGTSVLTDRLRTLEQAGVVSREPGPVGAGVAYTLTDRGRALDGALRELRRWGVDFLTDPAADGGTDQHFNVTYVENIDTVTDGRFQLVVDGKTTTLDFSSGRLHHHQCATHDPELVVRTTTEFFDRWAAGDTDWDAGLADGDVTVAGPAESWPRWLAATGYLLSVEPEEASHG